MSTSVCELPASSRRISAVATSKPAAARRTNWLKLVRDVHLYLGVSLGLALIVLGLTGVYMVHKDSWAWAKRTTISARWLPGFYARGMKEEGAQIRGLAVLPGNRLLIATQRQLLVGQTGADQTTRAPVDIPGHIESVRALSTDLFCIAGESGLFGYTPGDGTVRRLIDGKAYDVAREESGRLWLTLHHEGVRLSDDGGRTWSPTRTPLEQLGGRDEHGRFHSHGLAVATADGSPHVFVATADGLFRTSDGGESWAPAGLNGLYVRTVRAVARTDAWLLVAAAKDEHREDGGGGLWESNDLGRSWTRAALPDTAGDGHDSEILSVESGLNGTLAVAMRHAVYVNRPEAPAWACVYSERLFHRTGSTYQAGLGMHGYGGKLEKTGIQAVTFSGSDLLIGSQDGRVLRVDDTGGTQVVTTLKGAAPAAIPVGKLLDDLHTGKFFGDKLWLVYDVTAGAMVFFVLSGIYLWLWPKYRSRRNRRARAAMA